MERVVVIDGREYRMRASALIPRLYRFKFGRDMIADLNRLATNYKKVIDAQNSEDETEAKNAQLSILDLTIFENLAWLFCRHADPEHVPNSPDEWLESIDGIFSVYEILPEILALWNDSNRSTAQPVKK